MSDDDKVIFTFPVLWEGWECDSEAWVMERPDGKRYLMTTSHGKEYETDVGEFQERIDEYNRVIEETRKAIEMVLYYG